MKLLDEIIENLSSDDPNLNNALMKTKVLLHKLGEKQLIYWVDSELNGYEDKESVPSYRIINVAVIGTVSNIAYRHSNFILPTYQIDKEFREKFEFMKLTESVAVLEKFATEDEKLKFPLPAQFWPLFSQVLQGGYNIEEAYSKPSAGSILQVITEVRSRLLDFVLELSDKIPKDLEENLKEKSKDINTPDIFNNTIYGGGNISIISGDQNIQNVENRVKQNDFESLAQVLKENFVSQEDLDNLKVAIDNDKGAPEHQRKNFGKNVKEWLNTMFRKATESTWNVSLQTAGGLLGNAICAYYGWC